ncbi:MAG TPA: ABC transporter permease [Candidatus Methylomirabilis sp.]|nr:ABC transporter permease [Candidatus Methylomirabilis sp.]
MFADLWFRLRSLFHRRAVENELDDELRFHFDQQVQKFVDSGLPLAEAHRRARLTIGGRDQIREEYRDSSGVRFLESLGQDIRYAVRMLRKSPGFTAVAVLTLALGIGANTAMFSVINATLLKPLPYPNVDRMVLVWQTYGSNPDNASIVSEPNIADIQKQNNVLEPITLFDTAGRGYNLSEGSEPERIGGLRVSANFFDVLGVKPLLGRTFLPEEEVQGNDHEVVLSYGLWQQNFAGDPSLVGKPIHIDGERYTVVGVMPPQFEFQFWSKARELWVPAGYTTGDMERGSQTFVAISRLKPGVTLAQAKAELDTIGQHLSKEYPDDDARMSATVTPLVEFGTKNLKTTLLALLLAVGFVLLIACVNVANLLLARGATRQREMALRGALGATRRRLLRQLMTESVLLGFLGGLAGFFLAFASLSLFTPLLSEITDSLPFRPGAVSMDARVFAFTFLLSFLTGILFGLAPAFGTRSNCLSEPLKESGGRGLTSAGANRFRHVLVAAEVALALIVLTGVGLMIDSMARLLGVDPGFDPRNVLTVDVSTAQTNLYYSPPVDAHFCQEVARQIGAIPGVVSVGSISQLPLAGGGAGRGITIEGQPDPGAEHQSGAGYGVACPNFFRTLGVPVVAGREFTDQDALGQTNVIVINQAMARRYWPKQNPLGNRIKIGLFNSTSPWLTVVGVIGDFRHDGLDEQPRPYFCRPFTQAAWPTMTIAVRTASAPGEFEKPLKNALAQLGNYPPSNAETMEQVVANSLQARRFPMLLLGAFAFLALLLFAVGIAGVVSYSVVQRTHELGIRMALGAQPRDVLKLVLSHSMFWTLIGVLVGIAGAMGDTRLLGSMLFEVKPADPLVLGITVFLVTIVAAAASYPPARRAMKVDPMVALRYE